MYHVVITVGLCVAYIGLFFLFPAFFKKKRPPFTVRSLSSMLAIIIGSLLVYAVSFSMFDEQVSNRILHIFGGGFLSFLVCLLVVNDTRLTITRLQFFVFGVLLVSTLGVLNEIIEFVLQNYGNFIFAETVNDTWLDLVSNTIGALVAGALLTQLVPKSVARTRPLSSKIKTLTKG